METNKVILLFAIIAAIFFLFSFSSWTNAKVVDEREVSSDIIFLSTISPLFAGIFVVIISGILVLIVFD